MSFSWILFRYLAKRLLFGMFVVGTCLSALVFLIDFVEQLRTFSSKQDVAFTTIASFSLLKTPYLMEQVLPFVVLFGAVFTFVQLTRNSELVVVRASGMSVWQFIAPPLTVAILFGVLVVGLYNPISSQLYSRFEELQSRYGSSSSSFLKVSPDGIWLLQGSANAFTFIHALTVKDRATRLENVMILMLEDSDTWVSRIDAETAVITDGYWDIQNASLTEKGKTAVFHKRYLLETKLTPEQIQDSFASPDTISFWDLPEFIALAEDAGFTAHRHRIHWHRVLSLPLLLCAMVLIAASFSLRLTRLGGVGKLIMAGILFGFFLYFSSDITRALGISGNLPIVLAAWSPTIIALLLGTATLFYLEDG